MLYTVKFVSDGVARTINQTADLQRAKKTARYFHAMGRTRVRVLDARGVVCFDPTKEGK